MLDFEYEQKHEGDLSDAEDEQKKEVSGKPLSIDVELTFDVSTCGVDELQDMMLNGEFLRKLSARTIVRPRVYDRLLQSSARLKQAKAKSTTTAQRYKREQKRKAKHCTRGEALKELQVSRAIQVKEGIWEVLVNQVLLALLALQESLDNQDHLVPQDLKGLKVKVGHKEKLVSPVYQVR